MEFTPTAEWRSGSRLCQSKTCWYIVNPPSVFFFFFIFNFHSYTMMGLIRRQMEVTSVHFILLSFLSMIEWLLFFIAVIIIRHKTVQKKKKSIYHSFGTNKWIFYIMSEYCHWCLSQRFFIMLFLLVEGPNKWHHWIARWTGFLLHGLVFPEPLLKKVEQY